MIRDPVKLLGVGVAGSNRPAGEGGEGRDAAADREESFSPTRKAKADILTVICDSAGRA